MSTNLSDGILTNFQELVLPLIVICSGVLTNIIVIIVLSNKKFKTIKFEPARLMNVLAINDGFCILTIFFTHATVITPVSFLAYNIYFCKIFTFMSFFFQGVSSWLIVFINVERLISIRFSKFNWLKSMKSKMWSVLFIYVYNFCLYFFFLIAYNLVLFVEDSTSNATISIMYCQVSDESYFVISYIYIANTVVVPFLLMICCSIMLIKHIYEIRNSNA